ncbi:PREDICTED: uncharacterized protein LOC106101730 [Papilio polytes]|uniref:uncharacterized protein LOC106101730 n=1 Tax=Papilio polytes TaxID=76194 RepID=UPI0006762560|nr:PREDICTED: uncharacterized protein LOC106101730 [Papilio polytes]
MSKNASSEQIINNHHKIADDEQNDVYAASSSSVHADPSSAIDAASDFGPTQDASDNRRRRFIKSTRRTSSNETPYIRVAKLFAATELQRLKLEEDRERRQYELETRRNKLDTLRETNLHARKAVRAQICRDTKNIQQKFLKLIEEAIAKFSNRQ